jgi:hypothetical protein
MSLVEIARDTELWSGMFTFLAPQLPLSLINMRRRWSTGTRHRR